MQPSRDYPILVLMISDNTGNVYVHDLEFNFSEIYDGSLFEDTSFHSVNLSTFFLNTAFSSTDNLSYSVFAANNDFGPFGIRGDTFGFISSVTSGSTNFNNDNITFVTLSGPQTVFSDLVAAANGDLFTSGSAATAAESGSSLSTEVLGMQNNLGGVFTLSTNGSVGELMDLYALTLNNDFVAEAPELIASVILDINSDFSSASLTIGEVPVPAAFWLFASGLLGLGAASRRKDV